MRNPCIPAVCAGVLLLLACRKAEPVPGAKVPTPEDPVAAAALARLGPGADAAAQAAFREGAALTARARAQGLPPWMPGEADRPGAELDPATGLPLRAGQAPAWVAGARWAVEQAPSSRLALPLASRNLPPPEAWQVWNTSRADLVLSLPKGQIQLLWTGSALAWQVSERGFPASRSWRPMAAAPRRVAWSQGQLWLEAPDGTVEVLDRSSGYRWQTAVGPAWLPALAAQHRPPRQGMLQGGAEVMSGEDRRFLELQGAALEGEPGAALRLGRLLFNRDPRVGLAWMRHGAEGGDLDAMVELGVRLGPEHPDEARVWLTRAVQAGRTDLKPLLNALPSPTR